MARADLKLAAALIGSPLQAFAARLQCAAIAPVDEKLAERVGVRTHGADRTNGFRVLSLARAAQ